MLNVIEAFEYKPRNSIDERNFASVELVFLVIIEVSGFILNGAVLIIICLRYKFIHDKSRYLLLGNILLCDFILLCFIIPTSMKFASCAIESCRATVLESFCSSLTLLLEFSYICAIFTQACLAMDTVFKVKNSASNLLKPRVYWLVVVLSWLVSILPTIVSRLPNMRRENFMFYVDLQKCKDYDASECLYQVYIFLILHLLVVPIIPGCYFYLAFIVKRLRNRLKEPQRGTSIFRLKLTWDSFDTSHLNNNSENYFIQRASPQVSSTKITESALQDIKYLFADHIDKSKRICSKSPEQAKRSSISNNLLMPKRAIFTTPAVNDDGDITELNIEYIDINSPRPQTSHDNVSKRTFQSNVLDIEKPVLHQVKSYSLERSSYPQHLVNKSTQTSLVYESSSKTSEEWIKSSPAPEADLPKIPQTLLPATEHPYPPHYLKKKSKRPNNVNTVGNFTKNSLATSLEINQETKVFMHSPSPQWRFDKSKQSDTSLRKRTLHKRLDNAVSILCHHGLLLIAIVYICSVPYILVNKCSRLEFPSPAATVAVCLYYSTCVWYPIVYFFMSADFRRHVWIYTNLRRI